MMFVIIKKGGKSRRIINPSREDLEREILAKVTQPITLEVYAGDGAQCHIDQTGQLRHNFAGTLLAKYYAPSQKDLQSAIDKASKVIAFHESIITPYPPPGPFGPFGVKR